MNMFRNILTLTLFVLGLALAFTNPEDWKWVDTLGSHAVDAARFLGDTKPFSFILCWVLALALFMTRKQF
jgi:hypothetical protein